jgi:CRISPR/Cas system-associated exonuclease Cas4 (RecB family)
MPSIHLIAGDAAHKAIQAFHNTNLTTISMEGFFEKMRDKITQVFEQEWQNKKEEIAKLNLSGEEKHLHYQKTREMIHRFYQHHTNKIIAYKRYYGITLIEAWHKFKPKTETSLTSEQYGVTGRIDATHEIDGETIIIDYKTSKKDEIDTECVTQLAIYTLLHKENFGRMPDRAGIHFLRTREILMPTSPELLNLAKNTCLRIHQQTTNDQIEKYPRKISGLCKYRTGQCDYYQQCMSKKSN